MEEYPTAGCLFVFGKRNAESWLGIGDIVVH